MDNVVEEQLKQWTTSIFYVNSNNGYTVFEDGTKVESVANRFVSFPANMKHKGTSCTDEKIRVVINFNYFKMITINTKLSYYRDTAKFTSGRNFPLT